MTGETDWDRGIKAGFEGAFGGGATDTGVLAEIERATGVTSQILLRDLPEEHSPLLKLPTSETEPEAKDDSRYQVVGEIARGGVGVIFKGRDRDLGRDVALKVLRSELSTRPEIVQRFIEEAQIEGQLQHPGIIPVYGLALQADGRPYFAMKLVKGKTLSALLAERKDANEDRQRYVGAFEQVCQAMAYAHARGVIHRDLKPSNILVGGFGEVLVVDWGFAKVLGTQEPKAEAAPQTIVATVRTGSTGSESMAGSVMGTPAYMPPEQALGHIEDVDERSDVFSLGGVLLEVLTGDPPYVGDGGDQLIMASQSRLDDALTRLEASDADAELKDLCRQCLSPLKRDRPVNGVALAKSLSAYLTSVEERAREAEVEAARERAREARERGERQQAITREETERRRVGRERQARRWTLGVAAVVLLTVVLGGGTLLRMKKDRRARADRAQGAVARTVEEAEELRGAEKWSEAIEKLSVAIDLPGVDGVPEGLRSETARLMVQVVKEKVEADRQADEAARDQELLDRLDEIRFQRAARLDYAAFSAACAAAFSEHGLDVDAAEPAGVAKLIQARPSRIAAGIVAALDEWARVRRLRPELNEDWSRPHLVAQLADPDPSSSLLRETVIAGDIKRLKALANESSDWPLPVEARQGFESEPSRSGGRRRPRGRCRCRSSACPGSSHPRPSRAYRTRRAA